ncbi:MAG TPA: DNA repair protein RadA [Patescibacteria group bacterium]|nr:DNA repair protein RadA [Patescibacteria group bacterium]
MPKQRTAFVCQECGYDSPAYLGKCPECGVWNSFKEIRVNDVKVSSGVVGQTVIAQPLQPVTNKTAKRLDTGFVEMDTVLGGGIVAGSITLIAGDPGIGKSTLLLQLCINLALEGKKVLYVSAEESFEQVSLRAFRIGLLNKPLETLLLLSLTDTDSIAKGIEKEKPDLVIIDSVQMVSSENTGGLSGSVSQVRYATSTFVRIAKTLSIPILLVGHVTKEGMVAGPMVLSHMVDTVLFLEGEKFTKTRILRSLKNRFGPVDEVGVFLMDSVGMVEVKNPEQIFLSEARVSAPGSIMVVIVEGSRPFLIEIQALVVYSKLPFPKRVSSGVDNRRVELLLAVLQKHCRLPLETYDVFVNVAGGIKVTDPAADAGICLAIYASLKNIAMPKTVGIAEVGLLGELRNVSMLDKRVREAKKLGLQTIISAQDFTTLKDVLQSFGGIREKEWKQKDERHFELPKESE